MRTLIRQSWAGLRLLLVFTVLCGVAYPAVVWAVGQGALPHQANGSPVTDASGTQVGSELLAQSFQGERWFHPRPSVVGYGGDSSGASNLGPNSAQLLDQIAERRAAVAAEEGIAPDAVPPDALTASASGLDPDISPAYAEVQVPRVARANGLSEDEVRAAVREATSGRDGGFLGEPRVNVVTLNAHIASLAT